MKKLISFVLVMLFVLSFASCGTDKTENSDDVSVASGEESFISEESSLETTEETTEETSEESEASTESSEEALPENTMFVVRAPNKATISAGHKDKVTVSYNKQTGKYYASAPNRHGDGEVYTSKEDRAKELGEFVFSPRYKSIVDSPQDLSFYGLDSDENATAVISVKGKDNFEKRIRIGNKTEDGYFAACDDGDGNYGTRVYVVDNNADIVTKPIEYFVNSHYRPRVFDVYHVFYDMPSMVIETPEEKYNISYLTPEERANHTVSDAWKLTSPEVYFPAGQDYALCDATYLSKLFYSICNLSCENVEILFPEKEDMAKYGLDKAYRHYGFRISVAYLDIYMTKPDENGNMYIGGEREQAEGLDVYSSCYLPIGVINIKDFVYVNDTTFSFIDDRLITKDFSEVTSITLELNGESHLIDFVEDDNGYRCPRLNGVAESHYDNTSKLYNWGIKASITGVYTGALPKDFDISATINYGDKSVFIQYKYDEEKVGNYTGICVVDGKKAYTIDCGYDRLQDLLETMLKGEFIPD